MLKHLKICDWTLLVLTLLILASSLQLEITAGATPLWVWLHMAAGTLFLLLILRHLYLHFRWKSWWTRLVASRAAPSTPSTRATAPSSPYSSSLDSRPAKAPSPEAPFSPSPDSRPAPEVPISSSPEAPSSPSPDSRPAKASSCFNVSVPVQWSERKRAASPQPPASPQSAPSRNSRRPLRWLAITGILLLLSAGAAAAHWLADPVHSGIGALHGKIGFLFLILLIPNILRHRRFYLPRKPAAKTPLRPYGRPAPSSNSGDA